MPTHNFDFSNGSSDWCTHTNNCYHCGEVNEIKLDFSDYMKFYTGEYFIQEIWPNLSAENRELIQTGIHPKCWNEMFPEED